MVALVVDVEARRGRRILTPSQVLCNESES